VHAPGGGAEGVADVGREPVRPGGGDEVSPLVGEPEFGDGDIFGLRHAADADQAVPAGLGTGRAPTPIGPDDQQMDDQRPAARVAGQLADGVAFGVQGPPVGRALFLAAAVHTDGEDERPVDLGQRGRAQDGRNVHAALLLAAITEAHVLQPADEGLHRPTPI